MNKLLFFQLKRLNNKNILILLPILLFAIGVMGLLFGVMFYGKDAKSEMWLISVYNGYTQFTFLILIFVFVSVFSDDFSNGVYAFMNQLGFKLKNYLICKAVSVYIICFIGTNVFIIVTYYLSRNQNIVFLLTVLLSVNLSLIFIILFTIILSLLFKKTMVATLVGYGAFLAMNILNYIGYGLTNPADGNSISSISLRFLADHSIGHYSLEKINPSYFEKFGHLFAVLPALAWDIILLVLVVILATKEGKKNEI